jgi:hypothetical protein
MKRNIARTMLVIVSVAALYLSLAPAVQAAETCSNAKAAGKWGFTLLGTLILPTGPVPGAAVGRLSVDEAGNISGAEARNVGGGFANETITGSWTVNSDCTGTASFQIYESGVLVRTSEFSLVFVDSLKEIRAVEQSLTLPDGSNLPAVITVEGKRLFHEDGH